MRLLPVLKSGQWQGPHTGAQVHRWLGTADEPLAYVAYAWDSNEGLVYVTRSESEELAEMVELAFDNLDADEGEHEIVEADGSRLLVAAGHPFAAERVLTERHMLRAHEALGSDRIVVSVAKRGQLLAMAHDGSDRARATMLNLHREAWTSGGEDRVTDRLVVVVDGHLVETLTPGANGTVDGWTH